MPEAPILYVWCIGKVDASESEVCGVSRAGKNVTIEFEVFHETLFGIILFCLSRK